MYVDGEGRQVSQPVRQLEVGGGHDSTNSQFALWICVIVHFQILLDLRTSLLVFSYTGWVSGGASVSSFEMLNFLSTCGGCMKYRWYCVLIQLSILKTDCDTFLMSKCYHVIISCLRKTLRGDTTSNCTEDIMWWFATSFGFGMCMWAGFTWQNTFWERFHPLLVLISVSMRCRLEFACFTLQQEAVCRL